MLLVCFTQAEGNIFHDKFLNFVSDWFIKYLSILIVSETQMKWFRKNQWVWSICLCLYFCCESTQVMPFASRKDQHIQINFLFILITTLLLQQTTLTIFNFLLSMTTVITTTDMFVLLGSKLEEKLN